jgi:hypothetical protein
LCGLTIGAFSSIRKGEFFIIDDINTAQSDTIQQAAGWDSIVGIWRAPIYGLYVPATYSFWVLQADASRLLTGSRANPGFFHTINLLTHAVNVFLVYQILLLFFSHLGGAVIGALLFAFHPIQVESVGWISAFKDLCGAFWALLCIWFYAKFSISRAQGSRSVAYYCAALCAFALAALSKTNFVTLPVALICLDLGVFRRTFRQSLLRSALWLVAGLPLVYLTLGVQAGATINAQTSFFDRLIVSCDSLIFYMRHLFFPWPNHFD